MNGLSTDLRTWECARCTLINNILSQQCVACNAMNPTVIQPNQHRPAYSNGNNESLLNKIASTSAQKVDSFIDAIATQFNAFSDKNRVQVVENWLCPKCSQFNADVTRYCVTCKFDKQIEQKFFPWKCIKCGLKQPLMPLELKCPICRKEFSPLLNTLSRSMPDLNRLTPMSSKHLPTKPAEEDSLECAEIYANIVNSCVAYKHSFIDDSFPHSTRSIGDLRALDKQNLNIVWLRPHAIVTKEGGKYRWSIFNDPQAHDIEQGLLGNCWVMSALALIAERPDILERIFVTREYNSHGVYQIRLCIDGLWKTVVVDDFFPCHANRRMMVFGVGRNNQLWVSLVEKALAKNYGSYSRLRAGRMHEGLTTLTGFPCINIDIDSHLGDEEFPDMCWARLSSSLESNYLIGASCGAGRRAVDDRQFRGLGLMSQHAYSVLKLEQVGNERLIRLRNPWGTFVWSGIYGPSWLKQNSDLRRRLEPNGHSSGTFWMPFKEFVKYFDAVDISCVNFNWNVVRYPFNIGWASKYCGCVRMVITESTHVSISLFQKSSRSSGKDNVDIMILVHKEDTTNGKINGHPGQLVFKSERRIYDSLTADGFLQPGSYMIYAISLSKTTEAVIQPGGLVIHSIKPVYSEVLPVSMNMLRASIHELVLKHGRVETTLHNCMARILTTDFAGLIVMIDNLSENHVLQVQSDCQQSSNVISTRSSLLTFDCVPPLHRQILTVLSHFENTQSFSVSHRMQVRLSRSPGLGDMFPQLPNLQHVPGYSSESNFALHGPTSLYG